MRLPFRFRLDLASDTVALELAPLPDSTVVSWNIPETPKPGDPSPMNERPSNQTLDISIEGQPCQVLLSSDGLLLAVRVKGLADILAEIAGQPAPSGKPGKPGKPGKDRLL